MGAIFRREMTAYFTSPTAYVYFAVFNVFAGLFFTINCLSYASADMSGVFSSMFIMFIFLIPILTMRLLSEEKKQKTDQCLLTSPVSLSGIVLGKYFAALAIYSLSLVTFLLYAVILAAFAEISWAVVIGNIIGAFLLGSSFIAVGLFVSSLTENQVIAAIGGFVAMMLLYVIDMISSLANNSTVQKIISSLAFYSKYYEFTTGVFNLLNVIFFVSASAIFIFLTVRVLEKKRWA